MVLIERMLEEGSHMAVFLNPCETTAR